MPPAFSLPAAWPQVDATRAAAAIVIALLALALGKRVREATVDVLQRRAKVDPAVPLLAGRLAYFAILVVAALWILNIFGGPPTALLTLLGAAGLAVSLALQDVLRNLFAGVYLLVERPFTIGDLIEVKGVSGVVESVELRLTVLTTPDGLRVTVPNATVFTEVLVNRSVQAQRRWPLLVALPPAQGDMARVHTAIEAAARQADGAAPAPLIAVQSATAKGTLLQVGLWAPDQSALSQGILALRAALPEAAISVPGAPALPDPPAVAAPPRRVARRRPGRAGAAPRR